jgi:hypothetical protein
VVVEQQLEQMLAQVMKALIHLTFLPYLTVEQVQEQEQMLELVCQVIHRLILVVAVQVYRVDYHREEDLQVLIEVYHQQMLVQVKNAI